MLAGARVLGASSVTVKIETVSVQVLNGELPQTPGLCLQRFHDLRTQRSELLVRGVDVFSEYPMNRRFKRRSSSSEEDGHMSTGDRADLVPWIQPSDFKAENVTVVPLCLFYVCYRQFRYRLAKRRQRLLVRHSILRGSTPILNLRARPPSSACDAAR